MVFARGRLTVACNFLSKPVQLPAKGSLLLATHPLAGLRAGRLTLPPNSAAWLDAPWAHG